MSETTIPTKIEETYQRDITRVAAINVLLQRFGIVLENGETASVYLYHPDIRYSFEKQILGPSSQVALTLSSQSEGISRSRIFELDPMAVRQSILKHFDVPLQFDYCVLFPRYGDVTIVGTRCKINSTDNSMGFWNWLTSIFAKPK